MMFYMLIFHDIGIKKYDQFYVSIFYWNGALFTSRNIVEEYPT